MNLNGALQINRLSTSKLSAMENVCMASYKAWILKAKSDLHLAEKGIKDDDLTLDTAIYHTQQCAEKALKGFLACYEYPLSKTHAGRRRVTRIDTPKVGEGG